MIVSLTEPRIPEGSSESGSVYEGWSGQGRPTLTMGNPILGIGDLGWIMSWAKHQHWLASVAEVWIQCGHLSQVPATVVSLWFPCVLDLWSKGNPSFPKILWSGLLSQQGDESLIHIAWVLRICLWMMRSPRVVISIKTTRKSSTRGFLPMSQ